MGQLSAQHLTSLDLPGCNYDESFTRRLRSLAVSAKMIFHVLFVPLLFGNELKVFYYAFSCLCWLSVLLCLDVEILVIIRFECPIANI